MHVTVAMLTLILYHIVSCYIIIAKISVNKIENYTILLALKYSSISYFNTDNVKHQSYKYWKPEKSIASRTFPSTHFSQVSMKENSFTNRRYFNLLKTVKNQIVPFIHSRQFNITMIIIHPSEIKSK